MRKKIGLIAIVGLAAARCTTDEINSLNSFAQGVAQLDNYQRSSASNTYTQVRQPVQSTPVVYQNTDQYASMSNMPVAKKSGGGGTQWSEACGRYVNYETDEGFC